MDHNRRHETMIRTTQRGTLRLIIQTKKKYIKTRETEKEKTFKMTKCVKPRMNCEKKTAQNDEYDQDSSISIEDDADSTSSQQVELEDWIQYMKRSTREADEKMLTNNITNWAEIQKELAVAPSLASWYAKQRNMDQKRWRVEPRTCHVDRNSKESRKTSKEMGRRRERVCER